MQQYRSQQYNSQHPEAFQEVLEKELNIFKLKQRKMRAEHATIPGRYPRVH